ncbi:hypothetical protein NQZ68_015711 [Dissostichus eleginoides]|nr:hypothetical protein NQZ68_015711 [Dissostichus eleginoides]
MTESRLPDAVEAEGVGRGRRGGVSPLFCLRVEKTEEEEEEEEEEEDEEKEEEEEEEKSLISFAIRLAASRR